jgi:predicted metal-dependent HD superfamily phosphohydrolase
MIYIDPPYWPAHGTVFSHLVSDSSLAELHSFAAAAGIPERAFDRDHYDVPERRYAQLVAAGAVEVSGKELVLVLVASGLRIRSRHRNSKVRTALQYRWDTLMESTGHQTHDALREELLGRWSEPHRHYHGATHLLAVLEALDLLARDPRGAPLSVVLAAWFHDAVYDGVPGTDEEASAALAQSRLDEASRDGFLPKAQVAEVVRLVRLTATHDPAPDDDAGALLCDADLSVLGGSQEAYARYVAAVREDYAHIPDAAFAAGRAAVVERLLALDPLFRTAAGRELWAAAARRNLTLELDSFHARRQD